MRRQGLNIAHKVKDVVAGKVTETTKVKTGPTKDKIMLVRGQINLCLAHLEATGLLTENSQHLGHALPKILLCCITPMVHNIVVH